MQMLLHDAVGAPDATHITATPRLVDVVARAQRASAADPRLSLFFEQTATSQEAGRAFLERLASRSEGRDADATAEAIRAQLEAMEHWGSPPGPERAAGLQDLGQPVLVVNGKRDVVVPTANS